MITLPEELSQNHKNKHHVPFSNHSILLQGLAQNQKQKSPKPDMHAFASLQVRVQVSAFKKRVNLLSTYYEFNEARSCQNEKLRETQETEKKAKKNPERVRVFSITHLESLRVGFGLATATGLKELAHRRELDVLRGVLLEKERKVMAGEKLQAAIGV